MQEYQNGTLLKLRQTLRQLKAQGACEGSFKLQYAVDKTLRGLTAEHGQSEAHALEQYEDSRQALVKDHARTDENGHLLYRHTETGALLARVGGELIYHEDHGGEDEADTPAHEAGETWGGQEGMQAEAQRLEYLMGDREALQDDLEALAEETTEAEIHAVSPEVLAEMDLSGAGREIDTSVLELMEEG